MKSVIALVAEPSSLSLLLVKQLEKDYFTIEIFSDEPKNWIKYLGTNTSINIHKPSSYKENTKSLFDYIIFLDLSLRLTKLRNIKVYKKINLAKKLAISSSSKSLFIFPFQQEEIYREKIYSKINKFKSDDRLTIAMVFIGHFLVEAQKENEKDLFNQIIIDAKTSREIRIPSENINLYTTEVESIVRELFKILFSFSNYGKEIAIISKPKSSIEVFNLLKKTNPGLVAVNDKKKWNLSSPEVDETILVKTDVEKIITDAIISRNKVLKPFSKDKRILPKRVTKSLLILFALSIAIILLPLALLTFGSFFSAVGRQADEGNNLNLAIYSFNVSATTSEIAKKYFSTAENIPVVGKYFGEINNTSAVFLKYSLLEKDKNNIVLMSGDLLKSILGKGEDDIKKLTSTLALDLDSLFSKSGLLLGDLGSSSGYINKILLAGIVKTSVLQRRERVVEVRKIVNELPTLLGFEEPATYLLLIQNDSELRPTGGTISAFGLLTFSGGKLIDYNLLDTISSDNLLKGRVEPPVVLDNYLNTESWYLRDSNWDADFVRAATQAEWFIDKEMDRSVDGVLAIDLTVLMSLLEISGPINIQDTVVTETNLRDLITASESGVFLAVLTEKLIKKITEFPNDKFTKVAIVSLDLLEAKHVQIFLHSPVVQRSVSSLGWSGEVGVENCVGNCVSDWLGVVEANLGANNANAGLERQMFLDISLEAGLIKRELTIHYEYEESEIGSTDSYKAYVRVIAPPESGFSPIEVKKTKGVEEIIPEVFNVHGHKEAGIFIEIKSGESASLVFTWESAEMLDYDNKGEYRLNWRKQAGTNRDPISVTLAMPEGVRASDFISQSLTNKDSLVYNSDVLKEITNELSRDFVSRIYW